MLEAMPASLFAEWQEFGIQEPFGAMRQDARFGELMALTYNLQRGENDALTPADFFDSLKSPAKWHAKQTGQSWGQICVGLGVTPEQRRRAGEKISG